MEDKKTKIFQCGKELFAVKGFKDTNVADITKMAGMSVGSFYNYYSSKEKLFMDIFLEENRKLKESMMKSINPNHPPIELIKQMLALNIAGMRANPILCQWYNRDVFAKIEQIYREENGLDTLDFMYGDSMRMVQAWQSEGKMRKDLDCKMIMAMFTALINIDMHKEEIGIEFFPEIVDYMTEFVMKGLTGSAC